MVATVRSLQSIIMPVKRKGKRKTTTAAGEDKNTVVSFTGVYV